VTYHRTFVRTSAVVVGAFLLSTVSASAQPADPVQRIRGLYAAAAYEEVLLTLPSLDSRVRPELEQYRIFCLVALGRTQDAARAIEAMVAADPLFVPAEGETSPRIHEVFVRIRRQALPDIARRMYRTSKAALDRRDRQAAVDGFGTLLRVIDSVQPPDGDPLSEMRLLVAGFLDLSKALPDPAAAPIPLVSRGEVPPVPPLDAPPAARSEPSTATAAVDPAPAPAASMTPPVPVEQALPAWSPPNSTAFVEFQGAVRVSISEKGAVTSAELVDPVHPLYDPLLLQAAQRWVYHPAKRGEQPIKSEKIVQVVLRPR
jgi:hypothetical protein